MNKPKSFIRWDPSISTILGGIRVGRVAIPTILVLSLYLAAVIISLAVASIVMALTGSDAGMWVALAVAGGGFGLIFLGLAAAGISVGIHAMLDASKKVE